MEDISKLSLDITEQQYRENPALSYSMLSKYNREGFKCVKTIHESIDTPSLVFGSMVDTLITEPDMFEQKFVVSDMPKLSDSLKQIADSLFAMTCNDETCFEITDIPKETISQVCVDNGYYADPKYSNTRVSKVIEGCGKYYRLLKMSQGKQIVSTEEYNDACRCAETLRTDENTSVYFNENPFSDITDNHYQLKFSAEYNEIPLRCMVDCVHVNHKDKTVTLVDLKTTSFDEWEFPYSFLKYGYWIQAQLYWYIVRENMNKDPVFKDYKLNNFIFAVINRNNLQPLLWEFPDTQCETEMTYNEKHKYRCLNWRLLASRLWNCMNSELSVPINIHRKGTNNIVTALNNIDTLTI